LRQALRLKLRKHKACNNPGEGTLIDNYRISSDKNEMDFEVIYAFISSTYWASGIPAEVLKKAIENAFCFGVFTSKNEQVGFARVITDCATYAYLSDVFILPAHRGKGLSKWLVQEIVTHPELQGLRRFALVTQDAHKLYAPFGFKSPAMPEHCMEIWQPDVYKNTQTK
jgi:N-acetylglutamate synthase-like GNAT family acetyltransferase